MANTWVTDLTHFLEETGGFPPDIPGPALPLGEYLASIVAAAIRGDASGRPEDSDPMSPSSRTASLPRYRELSDPLGHSCQLGLPTLRR